MAFKGQNSRAVAAKERKRSAAEEKRVLEEKAKEDLQWVDDDKILAQKQRRKREAEEKQQRKLERKQDKKQLEEEEILQTQFTALRAEFPTLKRSQLLERVQKLWKTSPANPYSQKK
uniref:Coiled-coil domain-containing protein 124-like n=1 Tax=Dermatophagoides pteronyssinus TaxID=6956 RepID=A0A6P6Y4H8_DERPT|nr:coiled-coil domain-containing protein 124-like [Dermatophagoides pteronyssinus]